MLLNNRRFLQDKRIAMDNEIRGSLRTFGLKVGKVPRSKYEARVRELVGDNEKLRLCILPMLEARRVLVEQCKKLEKLILGHRAAGSGVPVVHDDSGRRPSDRACLQNLC